MRVPLEPLVARVREYDEIVGIGGIARRYFAMNAFDGIVTIIGVLTGSLAAGIVRPSVVVVTGLMTAVAMGISGFWGAYLTESAEREKSLHALERHTLSDLSQTRIGRASRAAVVIVTLVDGLAPMLSAAFILTPFYFARAFPSVAWAYATSLALALTCLAALGAYLGFLAGRRRGWFAAKTLLAGVVAIAAGLLTRAFI